MMMNYVAVTVIQWVGSYGTRHFCHMVDCEGERYEARELPVEEARFLQDKLTQLGAQVTTELNPLKPNMSTVRVLLMRG